MSQGFYFICGTKRSATHFLNRLFDGHPEIGNTIGESYIFEYYLNSGWRFEEKIINWIKSSPIIEVYENISKRQLLPAFKGKYVYDNAFKDRVFEIDFDYKSFCRRLETRLDEISSIRDLIRIWVEILNDYKPWNKGSTKINWVFKCADFGKTMLGAKKLNLIDSAVFLIRNPFHIANSIKKRREFEANRDFHVFVLFEICRDLESIPSLLEDFGGKYIPVYYEYLVNNQKEVLDKICSFWKIKWNDCLYNPTLFGEPWQINSSFSSNKNRKDLLTKQEKEIICKNTKIYCSKFGYDF